MNLQIKPLLFTIWTLAATLLPLRAQIVADGATNTLSNVTNNFTRDVTVGTNGSFTLLVLSDNTLLTGSANVIIGRNTTAKSNEVRLVSSSARWQLGGLFAFPTVYVGSNGAFNRLVVSNGATVSAFSGYVGVQPPASNNLALVTGPGSVWSMASLDVGSFSAGNQVIVSNGGVLYCAGSTIGTFPGGSNNLAVVTGSGSTWTNQSGLTLGLFGTGNQVLVSEGGALHNGHGSLGSDPAGSNNVALITGTGSVWSNALDLEIGSSSANNQMIVSNGAAVFAAGNGLIGSATNANGNSVTVTDPGTSWLIGNTLYVGSNGILNRLALNGGATASVGRDALIGGRAGANSNSVSVADAGTRWEIATNLYVGSNAMFNRLVVSNGATVANYSAIVGFSPLSLAFSGSSNEVVVTGVGSLWSNANTLSVGWTANGNRLVISNGAVVRSFTANICESLSSNNVVVVTDSGSAWTNQSALTVGLNGPLNRLIVTNAAVVDSGDGFIGGYSYSSNCEALITGAGSLWRNRANLTVGVYEGFSRLVVTNNGAAIALGAVVLGEFFGSTNNRIIVDGGALRATNAAGTSALNLIRGTNRFNAGVIEADQLIMTSTQGFFEFNGGTLITRGAVISNGLPFVVGASGATPAVWDVRAGVSNYFLPSDLYVGSNSSLNQLVITNGAFLTNSFLTLGVNPGANSNAITLSGAGSRYSLVAFNVGNGSFNRLVLSNGGSLNTSSSDFGVSSASSNNSAVVTGAGSVWTNLGFLVLGDTGRSNQLLVSDGGRVVSTSSDIGAFTASSDNVALVTGSDSVWNTLDTLAVGNNGPRNRLQVSNGGLVTAVNAVLVGAFNASTNNRLVVDGGALLVTNGAATGLLDIRRGTNVLTAGWIEVDELRVTNGGLSKFEFNGGTLSAKNSRLGLGIPFVIGNGVSPATFILAGNGTHDFNGSLVLAVAANATLTGNGSLVGGQLIVQSGGKLVPGSSVGKITLGVPPSLGGTIVMELGKNGTSLTNDQIQVTGALTYGGALIVTNLGPTALATGDRFLLFNATSYAGSFTSLTLPPLDSGLNWTNKLLVDGSIEIVASPAIPLSMLGSGSYTQNFDSLSMKSMNNLWRDNSTLLGWYAAKSISPTTITNYAASDGSDSAGSLYSFGSSGSSERALGSIPSNSTGDIGYGLCFTNDTANSVTNFMITYTGEQWRNGGSGGGGGANTLTFWYQVSSSILINPEPDSVTNWTQVTNLNFVSPTVLASATALNGNDSTNRQIFSSVLIPGLVVIPGQNVFFRWRDINDTGADQGMAVDDLMISFGPLQPQITSVNLNPTNGFLQIFGLGESNRTYGIEAATNLTPPTFWQRLGTNTADGTGLFQFTDTNAPGFPIRFYRALFP